MPLIKLDAKRLALSIRINQRDGHQIPLPIDGLVITKRQRPIVRLVGDGSPQIDYLESGARGENVVRFFGGEVTGDTISGGLGGLVDMN